MKTQNDESGTLVGYCRVSTEDQNLGLQVDALARAGVAPNMIFTDKVSGVAKRRPGRDLAIRQCRPGDTLVVWKLDRISRSVLDLLTLLNGLEERGIKFKSLTDPIDTTGPMGRGVKFGQPTIFTPEVQAKIWQWVHDGESAKRNREAARMPRGHRPPGLHIPGARSDSIGSQGHAQDRVEGPEATIIRSQSCGGQLARCQNRVRRS